MVQGIWSEEDEIRAQSRALHAQDDLDRSDDDSQVLYLVVFCGKWSGSAMHWDHDEADKEKAKQQIRDKHEADHPGCERDLTFGYI